MVLRKSIAVFYKVFALQILSLIMLSCHNQKKDYTLNLDGKYFFSENSNLSYYIPANFKGSYVTNDLEFNSLIKSIHHPKIKESIDLFYKNRYVLPEAYNAQYFYSEDSTDYAFLIINEVEHMRLNDKLMNDYKGYRNSLLRGYMTDSLATIDVTDDKFTNTSNFQLMTTRGRTQSENDSVFWEFYIASKFLQTFTIMTKSNTNLDLRPYIKAIEYGDKRNNI